MARTDIRQPTIDHTDVASTNALVTGASRGLGRALALELAARGARIALVARGEGNLRAVADEITDAGGVALPIVADVGEPEAAARITGVASASIGPINLVIHNASTLGPTPLPQLLDIDEAELRQVLEVNLIGPFRLTRLLAGRMALDGGGTIVHISSDAAVEAYPHWGPYGLSKAALDHLGRTWAAELAEEGVHFVIVDPGEMDTEMHRRALPDADPSTLARPEDVARELLGRVPAAASGTRLSLAH